MIYLIREFEDCLSEFDWNVFSLIEKYASIPNQGYPLGILGSEKFTWNKSCQYDPGILSVIGILLCCFSSQGGQPPHNPSVGPADKHPVATPVRAPSTRKMDTGPAPTKLAFTPTKSPEQKKVKVEHAAEALPKADSFMVFIVYICFSPPRF